MATTFPILARLRADTVAFAKDISSAFRGAEKRGGEAADSIGRRFAKATSKVAGRAFQAGSAGLAGAFGFGVRDALAFEQHIDNIGIQSNATAAEMDAFRDAVRATSEATGLGRVELGLAGETLVNLLGPAGRNAALLDLLGRTAVASGADVGELAGLISAVSDSFGIAVDDVEGMERALSAFLSAGKQGKVPLGEMNTVLQEVASNFAEMSSGGTDAAADVAAALQVARTAFGTAGQAGTGLKAGATALKTHGKEIDKAIRRIARREGNKELMNFTVWADKTKTKLKDFRELAPVLSKMNLEQLTKTMGSAEAAKFWAAFKGEGFNNFLSMADPAREATDVVEDFGKRTETEGFRVAKAWNDIKLAVADAITPEVLERVVSVVQKLASAVEFVTNNLNAALAALVAIKALQMATEFGKIGKAATAAAGGVGGLGQATGAAGGGASFGQKAAGAIGALTGGFAIGQIIGTSIVERRKRRFAKRQKEKKERMASTATVGEAAVSVFEQDLADEQGKLRAEGEEIRRRAAAKQLLGRELTQQESDVLTSIRGYDVERKPQTLAEGMETTLGGKQQLDRKSFVSSEETVFAQLLQAQRDATQMLVDELRANTQATKDSTNKNGRPPRSVGDMGSR